MPLIAGLQFSKSAFTYMEMGGAMIPGVHPPQVESSGTATLVNAAQIPAQYRNASSLAIFQLVGTNAEVPVTLNAGFSGPIPISLASFGTGTEATFRVYARSNVSALESSPVALATDIAPTKLRSPLNQEIPPPNGVVVLGTHWVTLSPDPQAGDTSVGARVFYTGDGSDPGDANGLPSSPTARLSFHAVRGHPVRNPPRSRSRLRPAEFRAVVRRKPPEQEVLEAGSRVRFHDDRHGLKSLAGPPAPDGY